MKGKFSAIALLVLMAVLMAACGAGSTPAGTNNAAGGGAAQTPAPAATPPAAPEELTIKHQLGEDKVKKNPQTVVVFDYGTLDSLDKLGVEVTAVPQTNIPDYLAKYKDAKYKNAGSLQEPDFEKINAMKPELIIISGRQSKHYDELKKIGPTVFLGVDNARYMESFEENAKTLGRIFGKEAEVDRELAKIKETVKAVKDKASAGGKNSLITLVTGGKATAYGPGSRFGLIHDVLGFKPVEDKIEVSTHGMNISMEFIAEKNPDYLFVVDRDSAVGGEGKSSGKEVIENELVKKTKAYQNGTIVYLDPQYWYLSGGGLISVAAMVEQVQAGLK